ncbi:MAG: tetratricopeptide repeat protein, partial [Myxococcota bacterium]
ADAGPDDAGVDAALEDAGTDAGVDAGVDAGAPVEPKAAPAAEPKRNFDWYLTRAEQLREREQTAAALDMYGKAGDLKPDRVEPIAGKGLCLLDMANLAAAEASFLQALSIAPRYGPAIMGLAEAYRMQGKNEKAIEYYQRYLDVLPNGTEAAVARNSIERLKKK